MSITVAALLQPQGLSTTQRDLLSLAAGDIGRLIYNGTTGRLEQWDGSKWKPLLAEGSSINGADLTGSVDGALLTGTVQGNLLAGSIDGGLLVNNVQAGLLAGDIDGGLY